jgi:cytoskeletal protein RodZ
VFDIQYLTSHKKLKIDVFQPGAKANVYPLLEPQPVVFHEQTPYLWPSLKKYFQKTQPFFSASVKGNVKASLYAYAVYCSPLLFSTLKKQLFLVALLLTVGGYSASAQTTTTTKQTTVTPATTPASAPATTTAPAPAAATTPAPAATTTVESTTTTTQPAATTTVEAATQPVPADAKVKSKRNKTKIKPKE